MNGAKVYKIRWLGAASVNMEYRIMVAYLDKRKEVDRLLTKVTVKMANSKCTFTRPFV